MNYSVGLLRESIRDRRFQKYTRKLDKTIKGQNPEAEAIVSSPSWMDAIKRSGDVTKSHEEAQRAVEADRATLADVWYSKYVYVAKDYYNLVQAQRRNSKIIIGVARCEAREDDSNVWDGFERRSLS